jgi:TolB-like protein/DNA-binding winged helix-turn-helix (wHTH) protein/Tfp pilus assembly protein PilF
VASDDRPLGSNRLYRFGDFELDLDAMQLRSRGEPVRLEKRPLDLLVMLVRSHGRMVGRDDIVAALWPAKVIIDFDSGLNTLVRKVRSALGDSPDHPKFVETVPGRGYRFVAAVTEAVPQAQPAPIVRQTPAANEAVVRPPERWQWRLVAAAASLAVIAVLGALVLLRGEPASSTGAANTETGVQGVQQKTTGVVTLAVLPFKPLTESDRNESLELGMTETLISGLNGNSRLQVAPLSSVRRYAGGEQDALTAGRQLGVAAVLEGYLQRAGDRLRVSVRLLDTRDGRQLVADSYDESFTDIFSVQDAIASRVQDAFMAELVGDAVSLPHETRDAEAYQLYANGRFYLRRNEAGMRRAIAYFSGAIERDPEFARAYVGLAEAYALLGVYGAIAPRDAFPNARAAVDKALLLDPELGEAYAQLGHIKVQYERDWPAAATAFDRAIALSPSYAPAHQWVGHYLAYMGNIDEGLARIRDAQQLEPASPAYAALIGMFLNYQRRYDEAIDQLTKTLEMDPSLDLAHTHLAVAYMYRGEFELAIDELARTSSVTPGSSGYLGQIYALSGRRDEALAEIERLMAASGDRPVAAHDIATIYAALGDADSTFQWLDRALEDQSQMLGWIRWNPVFDSIRGDARYAAFMQRLKLP